MDFQQLISLWPHPIKWYAHLRDEAFQKAGQVVGSRFKRRNPNHDK